MTEEEKRAVVFESLEESIQPKRGDSSSTLKMKTIWRKGLVNHQKCQRHCKKLKDCVNWYSVYAKCGECKKPKTN